MRHRQRGPHPARADSQLGPGPGRSLVQAAVAYYGAYPTEIDDWIELSARESEAAHAAWLAGQVALKR